MPILGSKVLQDLTSVEKELLGLVSNLQAQTSQKAATRSINDAKNIVGKSLQRLPSGDASISPVRKSLTVVLNTLSGLQDGLAEGISRSDFKNAVGKLKTRFIPQFRESLDDLSKKVKSSLSRLSDSGLLQSGEVIVDDLNKVVSDLKRLQKMLHAAESKGDGVVSQLGIAIRNRIDLVVSTYGMLPSGEQLDIAADLLAVISGSLNTLAENATQEKLSKQALRNLDARIVALQTAITNIDKLVRNDVLVFSDTKRQNIESRLKRKIKGNEPISEKDDSHLSRSPDEHLKDKITKIKSAKASLPKSISGPYSLIRSPVVAIFDQHDGGRKDRPMGTGTVNRNFNKNALLDQFGIKYVMLDDYVILQDQVMLAVDRKAVEAAVREMSGRKRSKKKAKDDTFVQYATQVIDMLNERGSQHFGLVSRVYTANPRNANMLLFWVMPQRVLDALIRRGWNKLTQWNLPFDH